MRIQRIAGILVAVLLLSGLALAKVQGKPYLVPYTCQQKLARAVYQTVVHWPCLQNNLQSLTKVAPAFYTRGK